MIISGGASINPIALKGLTKEQVYELLKGNLADDFEIIWIKIRAEIWASEVKPTGYDKDAVKETLKAIKPIMDVLNDKVKDAGVKSKKS